MYSLMAAGVLGQYDPTTSDQSRDDRPGLFFTTMLPKYIGDLSFGSTFTISCLWKFARTDLKTSYHKHPAFYQKDANCTPSFSCHGIIVEICQHDGAAVAVPGLCTPDAKSLHTAVPKPADGRSVMGIVWAVPVRPDRLGYALSIYAAKLKQTHLPLTAFHQQVAQNTDMPYATLPPELMSIVDQLVLDSEIPSNVEEVEDIWLQGYLCSQHACTDAQHATDDIIEEYASEYDKEFGRDNFVQGDPFPWDDDEEEWMKEDPDWEVDNHHDACYGNRLCPAYTDKCDCYSHMTAAQQAFLDHRDESVHPGNRGGGTRRLDPNYKEEIAEWIMDQEEFDSDKEHSSIITEWLELFDQRPGGHFAKLDKVSPLFQLYYLCLD
jgi:hypothetical protein